MALQYENLDNETRRFMSDEIDYDQTHNNFYLSQYLNDHGKNIWPDLLAEAINHDDNWLEVNIIQQGLLATFYTKRKPNSMELMQARVPVTAAQTLAEGEFNRLYIRGLCARVISEGENAVTAYRARYSANPRPESEGVIGRNFIPQDILQDLRTNIGVDSVLGLPPGPNSGISIKKVS